MGSWTYVLFISFLLTRLFLSSPSSSYCFLWISCLASIYRDSISFLLFLYCFNLYLMINSFHLSFLHGLEAFESFKLLHFSFFLFWSFFTPFPSLGIPAIMFLYVTTIVICCFSPNLCILMTGLALANRFPSLDICYGVPQMAPLHVPHGSVFILLS